MGATERFAELLARPRDEVPLDEAALLIAAHAYPQLDVRAELGRLDEIAAGCGEPTLDGLLAQLFIDLRFVGNRSQYFDPRNSFLNDVMTHRTGIPISLAVLTIAVGRRIGVPLRGIGMPGHFLLRDQVDPTVYVDPFAGGAILDRAGCRRAFAAVHGDDVPFDEAWLEPVDTPAILGRMLANLRSTFAAGGNREALTWVLRLRVLIPGVPAEERAELASVLASDGRFAMAAREFDLLAGELGGGLGEEYRRTAARLRARLN